MDGAVNLKQQKKPVLPRMKKYAGFYVLFLPVLAFLVVFHYLPMFGIYYSFTKYTIIKDPVWVGLANFERLFAMPNFWNAFQNTLELSVVKLLLTTTFSVVLSLLLNEMQNIHGKKLAQTIIYLPHFMSWVVTASVFQLILSPATAGLVNQVLIVWASWMRAFISWEAPSGGNPPIMSSIYGMIQAGEPLSSWQR